MLANKYKVRRSFNNISAEIISALPEFWQKIYMWWNPAIKRKKLVFQVQQFLQRKCKHNSFSKVNTFSKTKSIPSKKNSQTNAKKNKIRWKHKILKYQKYQISHHTSHHHAKQKLRECGKNMSFFYLHWSRWKSYTGYQDGAIAFPSNVNLRSKFHRCGWFCIFYLTGYWRAWNLLALYKRTQRSKKNPRH